MTLVKICGITNLADALAAVDAGAEMLGFNFYPLSSRYITPQNARQIINELPEKVITVGLFVNEETPQGVEEIASVAGTTALQLHGDETPDYCRSLAYRYVIKAVAVGRDFTIEQALTHSVNAIMLDAQDDRLRGGTGRVVDWSVARRVRELVPNLFLAGGLSPENIAEAILSVNPYAVDACSALEAAPGKKDHQRLREFVRLAHAVKP